MNFTVSLSTDITVEYTCKSLRHKNKLYLYEGWTSEQDIDEVLIGNFESLKKLNGEFFAVEIDYDNKKIKVLNDKHSSFMLYYDEITKTVSTDIFSFKKDINDEWFTKVIKIRKNVYYYHTLLDKEPWTEYGSKKNDYALKDVKYIPQGAEVTIDNNQIIMRKYYDSYSDFFNVKPIYFDETELIEFTKNRLENNIRRIIKQYNKLPLTIVGSTGLDSLSILNSLPHGTDFTFLNYYFLDNKESSSCFKNAKRLIAFLKDKGRVCKIQNYTTCDITKLLEKYHTIINHFNHGKDVLYDVFAYKEQTNNKQSLILKGTYGDECFWHDDHAYCLYLKSKGYSFDQAKEFCKSTYAYVGEHSPSEITKDQFKECNNHWMYDVAARQYFKTRSYITSDRLYNQRPTFAPYGDFDLMSLPLKCDKDELRIKCIDGTIQKSFLGEYNNFLNANKDGEQTIKNNKWEIENLDFYKQNMPKQFYYAMIKNKQSTTFNFSNDISYIDFENYVLMLFYKNLLDASK